MSKTIATTTTTKSNDASLDSAMPIPNPQTDRVLTPYIKLLLPTPPQLQPSDLSSVIRLIFQSRASEVQIASFLSLLRARGLDQDSSFIAAAVDAVLEFAETIQGHLVDERGYIDIVGTGGDGQNTFNVSTSSAIVAAGMGLPVCKHGGKASTSTSGSGDLLKSLGVELSRINVVTLPDIVQRSKFCYLFAPSFHPGMGIVANVRAQLGIPTIFNILGPLINPIPIQSRILGVYSEKLGESYARAASILARKSHIHKRTMVVFGECVLDEIAPSGYTKIWMVEEDGEIKADRICPKDFGLGEHELDAVRSGSPDQNAEWLGHILRQDKDEFKIVEGRTNHPIVDYILLNTAALAFVAGLSRDWAGGVELAKESIKSGKALEALQDLKDAIA